MELRIRDLLSVTARSRGKFQMFSPVAMLSPDYVFSDSARLDLCKEFAGIPFSPYRCYEPFRRSVRELVESGRLPRSFTDFCRSVDRDRRVERPVVLIRNCPIDQDVETFDPDDPLYSKYRIKKTFIAEAFLEAYAFLSATRPVGRLDISGGDVFYDIYPSRIRWETHSSRGVLGQPFHKDLGNQPVVPEHLYMIGMRTDPANEVYTSFVRNVDVIGLLDEAERELLRAPVYVTPSDPDLRDGGVDNSERDVHPILTGEAEFRFIEGRTRGTSPESRRLAEKLALLPHEVKKRLLMQPGDFVAVCNNLALHGREVVRVGDENALRTRWLIKSLNLDERTARSRGLMRHTDYLLAGPQEVGR
ncbi:hypothetical protein [Streptomyces odontomachi]|uniref:hypothetical protein n=1 Tax=Streptomyces odontomachi TaxID=2944940 RepID=UPI00210AD2F4|nr:hypothetical protein [Streptomyces sp. ODS25]